VTKPRFGQNLEKLEPPEKQRSQDINIKGQDLKNGVFNKY
jgi:hypothetical protein